MNCRNAVSRFLIAGVLSSNAVVFAAPGDKTPAPKAPVKTPANAPASANALAAEVNGDKIPLADVMRQLNYLKEREPSLKGDSPEAKKAVADLRETIIEKSITLRLLAQEAKRRKIVAPVAEVDKAVAEFKSRFKDEASFVKSISLEGKTPNDLRQFIAEGLAINELTQQWISDVTVPEAEIATFYRNNQKDFSLPEAVSARHILLAFTKDMTPAEREKKRVRAGEILKLVQAPGADWKVLARDNSDDPGSKNEGGDLGLFTREEMVKPFADAAFAAPVGKVIGPIESEFGYHVIRVDDKKTARVMTIDEARPLIKPLLLEQRRQTRLEQKIEALRAAAKIKKFA